MSKKRFIFIIFILMILCSCGLPESKIETSDVSPSLSEEKQNARSFNRIGALMTKDASSQTLYFLNKSGGAGQYLAYADMNAEVTGILCGKAECLHDSSSCNAFLGSHHLNSNICFYQDHIYWIMLSGEDLSYRLYRMDMNGENHREVFRLSNGSDDKNCPSGNIYLQIADDKVVLAGAVERVTDGEYLYRQLVNTYDLSNGNRATVFDSGFNPYNAAISIQCRDHFVYYAYGAQIQIDSDENRNVYKSIVGRISLSNGNSEVLYDEESPEAWIFWEFTPVESGVYFITSFDSEKIALYYYDFKSSLVQRCFLEGKDSLYTCWMTDQFVVSFERLNDIQFSIVVYDFTGKKKLDRSYTWDGLKNTFFWFCGSDQQNLYFQFQTMDMETSTYTAVPLDGSPMKVIYKEGGGE